MTSPRAESTPWNRRRTWTRTRQGEHRREGCSERPGFPAGRTTRTGPTAQPELLPPKPSGPGRPHLWQHPQQVPELGEGLRGTLQHRGGLPPVLQAGLLAGRHHPSAVDDLVIRQPAHAHPLGVLPHGARVSGSAGPMVPQSGLLSGSGEARFVEDGATERHLSSK